MGDLVMYMGKESEYSSMHRRIVYQCIAKEPTPGTSYSAWHYRFRAAFDFENPVGTDMNTTGIMGTHDLKHLSLLDLATLRLHFDNFLREWAKKMGQRDPDEVR